jgi:DNA-binding MurR/RpiR family transcriptional regulator
MSTNIHVVTTSGEGEMFEKIVAIKPEDVVIAISFPRYSSATVKAAQYCRANGATVIGLTDSRLSPLGQSADFVLEAKSDMVSLVDSLVAPMSIINALVVAIAARREERLSKIFTSLEKIWDEYHVYEKQEGGNGI